MRTREVLLYHDLYHDVHMLKDGGNYESSAPVR